MQRGIDFSKVNPKEALALMDYLEGREKLPPETFECIDCGEEVETNSANSYGHKLCWMCLENYG